jgi:uncharacterized protein
MSSSPTTTLITGATGFIGQALCHRLLADNYHLTLYVRSIEKAKKLFGDRVMYTDNLEILATPHDQIINLAGFPISVRWSAEHIQKIEQSRFDTTQHLINYIARIDKKPQVLLSGSAIGYYGNSDTEIFDENSPPADNSFAHQLCAKWEKLALQAEHCGVRVVLSRTGVVLGKGGGMLGRLLSLFRLGLGGKLGSGRQYLSWVHLDDLINSFVFVLEHEDIQGAFNATAPNPVSNIDFTRTFAKALHRPAWFATPALMLKLAYGKMAEDMLLQGQQVVPKKLLEAGFAFRYPELVGALEDVCG